MFSNSINLIEARSSRKLTKKFEACRKFNLVIMLLMDTPVPIPNTKVKHQEADSTAREAVWEGRLLPGF